jgi:hypothetical protein
MCTQRQACLTIIVGVTLLGLTHARAYAQDALGDGQKLDNNLRNDSQGKNDSQEQIDFAGRNDVVTGNVPGLGYFHDNVGYGAPNEFRGSLAEDELFRINARSLSTPVTPNMSTGMLGTSPVKIYRSQAASNLQEIRGGSSGYQTTSSISATDLSRLGASFRLSSPTTTHVSTTPLTTYNLYGLGSQSLSNQLGYVQQPNGQFLRVEASPLLGVRQQALGATTAANASGGLTTERTSAYLTAQGLRDQLQLKPEALGTTTPSTPKSTQGGVVGATVAPAPEKTTPEPGDQDSSTTTNDPYLLMLEKVKDNSQQLPSHPSAKPTDQKPADPRSKDAGGGINAESTDVLVKMLDYDLPRFHTLIDTREKSINDLAQNAQDDLLAGRYINAENKYLQLRRLAPDRPLVQVGLIHAQIGAGMMLSANSNLRRMFDTNPEIIAARYDYSLLPGTDRLKWARAELSKMIDHTEDNSAAVLLAYISYQLDDPGTIKASLEIAAQRDPNDTLIPLLKGIWLDTPAGSK